MVGEPAEIKLTGVGLRRPECVLAQPSGDLWVADLGGGVVHIDPDGVQKVVRHLTDGFAFDVYGNLWTTLIGKDRLIAITTEGEVLTIWEDGDGLAPRMASLTFGGPDLRTVYVGSLGGTSLPTFRSPVPGAPLPHWTANFG